MSGKRTVLVYRGYELANALYTRWPNLKAALLLCSATVEIPLRVDSAQSTNQKTVKVFFRSQGQTQIPTNKTITLLIGCSVSVFP